MRTRRTPASSRLLFVTSCFNEAENVEELYRRCRDAYETLKHNRPDCAELDFGMVFADNCSQDKTLEILEELAAEDPSIAILANAVNYGAEASAANALAFAEPGDLVIALNSDLQDPPEASAELIQQLLSRPDCDGVLAVKQSAQRSILLSFFRRLYYAALGYSTRLRLVPSGFHGFGAYRWEAIEDALHLWRSSNLNLRMCLANGCQSPQRFAYQQQERLRGVSSYRGLDYAKEAILAILSADSTASRLAFVLSGIGLILAMGVAALLLLNWLGGNSQYEPGLPTVMALILGSFAMQMLMIAVLSRQVEDLRMIGIRPRIRHQRIGRPRSIKES